MADRPKPSSAKKSGRLTRSADFDRVFRRGRSYSNRNIVLHLFPRSDEGELPGEESRVGLSVSRKVGGAVTRNLVKRLLREAAATELSALSGEFDIVIVARPDIKALAEREGLSGVRDSLADVAARFQPEG